MGEKKFLAKLRALPEGRRMLAYLALCLVATLLVTGAVAMEQQGAVSMGSDIKVLVGLAALLLAGREARISLRHGKSLPWMLLLALVAPLIYLVFRLGPASLQPTGEAVAMQCLSILTTAYWEESLFRLWGRLLFEEEEGYKARNFLLLAVIFGSMHLVNLLNSDPQTVLLQVVFAILTGLFLQTLYTWTGSLALVVTTHICINASQLLPTLWVPAAERYLARQGGMDLVLTSLFFALSAALITRRGELIKRGRPFLNLGKKKRGNML